MDNKDLKYLKKHYGENFSHLCRELFPTILEKEGRLLKIISKKFAHSHSLYEAVASQKEDFKTYIYTFVNVKKKNKQDVTIDKSPEELFNEAGYILYPECQIEKDVQSFKKYYAPGEALCTFRGGRLNHCRVWFAVKKNVDEIIRKNFTHPSRQDEYGTSVISIQFTKSKQSTLSIKNRYNHRVNQPDATFGNNLDNIIDGLTNSFTKTYNINLIDSTDKYFHLPDFVIGNDGRYYRSNLERNNIHYCENNTIIEHGNVRHLDKSKYLLIDKYIINLGKNKSITKYENEDDDYQDSFTKSIGKIEKLNIISDSDGSRTIYITSENNKKCEIKINNRNDIIGYYNEYVEEIGDDFFADSRTFMYINLPNLKSVGDNFFLRNIKTTKLYFPNLENVGHNFFKNNKVIDYVYMPNLKSVKDKFLYSNTELEELNLSKLINSGDDLLFSNKKIKKVDLSSLASAKKNLLYSNEGLTEAYLNSLVSVKDCCLRNNKTIKILYAPNLTSVGESCFDHNEEVTEINLPSLTSAKDKFFYRNNKAKAIITPNLTSVKDNFVSKNTVADVFNFSSLISTGAKFLDSNPNMTKTRRKAILTENKAKLAGQANNIETICE